MRQNKITKILLISAVIVIVVVASGITGYFVGKNSVVIAPTVPASSNSSVNQEENENTPQQNEIVKTEGETDSPPTESNSSSSNEPPTQDISNVFEKEGGCGNIYVYKLNESGDIGISVGADVNKLDLSPTPRLFKVEDENDGLKIELLVGNIGDFYCNDTPSRIPDKPDPEKLVAKTGEVTILISEVFDRSKSESEDRKYKATVILENINFMKEDGSDSDMIISNLVFENTSVGYIPG